MLENVLAEVQPQTEYESRGCLDSLQEAKEQPVVAGVSPMQLFFDRNPEIVGGSPERQSRSQLVSARPRRWTGFESSIDREKKIDVALRQAECQESVGHLPGDIVAAWRMIKGCGIPGKRAHQRWRPGVCMGAVRGNCWS